MPAGALAATVTLPAPRSGLGHERQEIVGAADVDATWTGLSVVTFCSGAAVGSGVGVAAASGPGAVHVMVSVFDVDDVCPSESMATAVSVRVELHAASDP